MKKKNRAFRGGLVTNHFVGYLFYYFLPRRGCRKEKKSCAFNTSLERGQNITFAFEGLNPSKTCTDFPTKRLSLFLTPC